MIDVAQVPVVEGVPAPMAEDDAPVVEQDALMAEEDGAPIEEEGPFVDEHGAPLVCSPTPFLPPCSPHRKCPDTPFP